MISAENKPINVTTHDQDFTLDSYRELVRLVLRSYSPASYRDIPWGTRFVLWRHDCDFSLNRALALAKIEADCGLRATYFLHPHSTFYNLLEKGQIEIVKRIIELGHDIGLHFDAEFFAASSSEDLGKCLTREADMLEYYVGLRPGAFSFHNPTEALLKCDAESYGGLINCYSRRFKNDVPYCSDSNGYWRFRRLHDVLTSANDSCLQVLTHPGWWQDVPMPPRQRLFRSAYGRAAATVRQNDQILAAVGRQNFSGQSAALIFLRDIVPERYDFLDMLWMRSEMAILFLELWRLHDSQIHNLCKAVLCKEWGVSDREVNTFFENAFSTIEGPRLLTGIFGQQWGGGAALGGEAYLEWATLRTRLVYGWAAAPKRRLEEGCVFLCEVMASLATLGRAQSIAYDGFASLGDIDLSASLAGEGGVYERVGEIDGAALRVSRTRWEQFKADMIKTDAVK